MEANLGGGRAGFGMAIKGGYEFVQPIGGGDGVVVDDGDEIRGSFAGGQIDSGAEAGVDARMEDGDALAGSFDWPVLFDAPAAAVVYNHIAKIPIGLPVQAVDAVPQSMIGGKCWNDDGDPIRLQFSIVRRARHFPYTCATLVLGA